MSAQGKHTPGPWVAVHGVMPPDDEGNERSFVRPVKNDGWQIAQTVGPNGKANAEFLASAPDLKRQRDDLLKAAEHMVQWIEAECVPYLVDTDDNPGQYLRDAITKARGGQK